MTTANNKLRDSVQSASWNNVAALLQGLDAMTAAQELGILPFEQQQEVLRHIPLDLAAAILSHFRYYDQYVLLHSLATPQMRALVDRFHPNDRMRFFDELPEETWQRLMDELSGAAETETLPQPETEPARVPAEAAQPAEVIIEAKQIQ